MKKKILNILLALVLTLGIVSPFATGDTVLAKSPPGKRVEKEYLEYKVTRLDQYTTSKELRELDWQEVQDQDLRELVREGKAKVVEATAEISSLPQTLEDLETLITCEWRQGSSIDGVTYYETGNNLFYAKVTGSRVSTEYEGKLAAWDPDIYAGKGQLQLIRGPTIVEDPMNGSYRGNTIRWIYELKSGGFLGIGGTSIVITRFLRQIEGSLQEYYILEDDPVADLRIASNYGEEPGFNWTDPVSAWDANGTAIKITGIREDKVINRFEFSRPEVVFPITIDPTVSFYTSSSDGMVMGDDSIYSTARGLTSGDVVTRSSPSTTIGQALDFDYTIYRSFFFFTTSSLPNSGIEITSAYLRLYGSFDFSDTNFNLVIQEGMPTFPHDPLVLSDYNRLNYSGELGQFSTVSWSGSGYNPIPLSYNGRGEINLTGVTKFAVRSSRDLDNIEPSGLETVGAWTYEKGSGYQPQLEVTYNYVVVVPIAQTLDAWGVEETTAELEGRVTDDGGAVSSARFQYGLTTAYGSSTYPWQGGMDTGDYFGESIGGLSAGTVYNYAAEVQNSAGSDLGENVQFLTKPEGVTALTVTPGNVQNQLNWTLGTGSTKTRVEFKTTGFPLFVGDGTSVYEGVANNYLHPGLTNGITYYYTLWALTESGTFSQYSNDVANVEGTPFIAGPTQSTTMDTNPVGATTATFRGRLDDLGGAALVDCYFEYYLHGAAVWGQTTIASLDQLDAQGLFDVPVAGLNVASLYHVRTVTDGGDPGDPSYGADNPFTTGQPSAPTMTTSNATGVTQTTATLWTIVIDDGDTTVTGWFEWGETTELGQATDTATSLETGDQIWETLIGLIPGTTYYFRGAGQNSVGTGYGATENFTTTAPSIPTVATSNATDIGSTSAVIHGLVLTDGGMPVEVRFQYGANVTYSANTSWMPDYITGNPFEWPLTSLNITQEYHFRAQARNTAGTANGSDVWFTTIFAAPSDFTAVPLSKNSISLTWESQGDQTGVFVKVGSFPVDRLDGDQVYFGPAEGFSHTDLNSGTTYFYRAWSWRDGDIWSTAYSEDAATTTSGAETTVPGAPDVDLDPPEEDERMFQTANASGLSTWPGYQVVEDFSAGYGMPSGSGWFLVAMVVLTILGGVIAGATGSVAAVLITISLGMILGTFMGILSFWVLVIFFPIFITVYVFGGRSA